MSTRLQKRHQKEVEAVECKTPDRKRRVKQSTVGFFDDRNNCVMGKEGMKIGAILKTSAQKWEELLYASG